ncbi:MAG TPA: hypothetical protein VK074_00690, partial [Fodinibius sp.]|nr:hypothetical protein [Fodinibius sp.]
MMKNYVVLIFFVAAGIFLTMTSCEKVQRTLQPQSPYEQYQQALLDSKLADRPMVRKWMQAGDSVLHQAVETTIPLKSTVTYFKDDPVAYSWKLDMKEGRVLHARISATDTTHQVFMDLFVLEDEELSHITSAEDSLMQYEIDENQTLLLRLQPELLVSGSITLILTDQPSIDFPVAGANPTDIKSFWGAPRDGGARRHEGVDIFAERGTPVV